MWQDFGIEKFTAARGHAVVLVYDLALKGGKLVAARWAWRGLGLPQWREQAATGSRPGRGKPMRERRCTAGSHACQRKAPFGSELPKGAFSLQAVARFILSA